VVHNSRWSKWDEPGRQWEQTSMPLSRNYVSLTELQAQVDKLASKVETLQSENDFLFALLDDAGLLTAELDRAVTDATGKPTIVLPARVSEDKDDEGEATATPEPQAPAIAPPPAVPAMSQIWQEGSESFPDPDKVIGFPS
jgi:hypothetical protein